METKINLDYKESNNLYSFKERKVLKEIKLTQNSFYSLSDSIVNANCCQIFIDKSFLTISLDDAALKNQKLLHIYARVMLYNLI